MTTPAPEPITEYLDPPYQFFHPQPGVPFELPVQRWEVGLATRPIVDPPYAVTRPTIRFHLAQPIPPDLFLAVKSYGSAETVPLSPAALEARPYVDFTNQVLIRKILAIYRDLRDRPPAADLRRRIEELERIVDSSSRPLVLRLTRHGLRLDTIYDVEVVGV